MNSEWILRSFMGFHMSHVEVFADIWVYPASLSVRNRFLSPLCFILALILYLPISYLSCRYQLGQSPVDQHCLSIFCHDENARELCICCAHFGSHWPHMAIDHLHMASIAEELVLKSFATLINLHLNSHRGPVATVTDSMGLCASWHSDLHQNTFPKNSKIADSIGGVRNNSQKTNSGTQVTFLWRCKTIIMQKNNFIKKRLWSTANYFQHIYMATSFKLDLHLKRLNISCEQRGQVKWKFTLNILLFVDPR